MHTIIGQVNSEELEEIRDLYEREAALRNLLLIELDSNIKNKIISDLDVTQNLMSRWWEDNEKKYDWKGVKNGKWAVSFLDGKVALVQYE